jgi:hypothetical protein
MNNGVSDTDPPAASQELFLTPFLPLIGQQPCLLSSFRGACGIIAGESDCGRIANANAAGGAQRERHGWREQSVSQTRQTQDRFRIPSANSADGPGMTIFC